VRQIARPDSSGIFVPVRPVPELAAHVGRYLCAKFQGIWEETLCLQAAMEKISQAYLEGEDILFADSRGAMDTATAAVKWSHCSGEIFSSAPLKMTRTVTSSCNTIT